MESVSGPYASVADHLVVRAGPGKEHRTVASLRRGRILMVQSSTAKVETIGGKRGAWYAVHLRDGREGYVFSAFLALAKAGPAPTDKDLPESKYCAGVEEWSACAQAVERALLPTATSRVTRSGNTLSIRLTDGSTKEFQSQPWRSPHDPQGVVFALNGYFPAHDLFLVKVIRDAARRGDSLKYLLVHGRDGRQTQVWHRPRFSPSGRRFVVAAPIMGFGGPGDGGRDIPSGVQLFEMEGDQPVKKLERGNVGCLMAVWRSEDRVEFTCSNYDTSGHLLEPAELEYVGGRWVFLD